MAAKKFDLKAATAHGAACDCAAHRIQAAKPDARPSGRAAWIGSIVPLLACAFCPACLSLWVPALASAGLAVAWTETDHHLLLGASVALSLALAAWRAFRSRRVLPVVLGTAGCGLLVLAHLAGESLVMTLAGAAILVGAPALERRARERAASASVLTIDEGAGSERTR